MMHSDQRTATAGPAGAFGLRDGIIIIGMLP